MTSISPIKGMIAVAWHEVYLDQSKSQREVIDKWKIVIDGRFQNLLSIFYRHAIQA